MRRLTLATLLLAGVAAGPVVAQSDPLTQRVGKLEKEMTAVQRKVFPNGVAIEPEIGNSRPAVAAGNPASSPVADLGARVDALEGQLTTLTGQIETDGNRIRKIEDALKAYDARLKALEGTGPIVSDEGGATGRSKADAPEIDGSVFLRGARGAAQGDLVSVLIEDADEHDLYGVPQNSVIRP